MMHKIILKGRLDQGCIGSVDSRSVAFFLESRVVSNFAHESQSRSKSRSKKSMGRKVRVATDRLRPTFCKNSLQNKTFFLFLFTNFCSDISLEPWKNIRKSTCSLDYLIFKIKLYIVEIIRVKKSSSIQNIVRLILAMSGFRPNIQNVPQNYKY